MLGHYPLSDWDSAIVSATRALNCGEVLSEDMTDGQVYAGVKVMNPFKG